MRYVDKTYTVDQETQSLSDRIQAVEQQIQELLKRMEGLEGKVKSLNARVGGGYRGRVSTPAKVPAKQ